MGEPSSSTVPSSSNKRSPAPPKKKKKRSSSLDVLGEKADDMSSPRNKKKKIKEDEDPMDGIMESARNLKSLMKNLLTKDDIHDYASKLSTEPDVAYPKSDTDKYQSDTNTEKADDPPSSKKKKKKKKDKRSPSDNDDMSSPNKKKNKKEKCSSSLDVDNTPSPRKKKIDKRSPSDNDISSPNKKKNKNVGNHDPSPFEDIFVIDDILSSYKKAIKGNRSSSLDDEIRKSIKDVCKRVKKLQGMLLAQAFPLEEKDGEDNDEALELNGECVEGRELQVTMATDRAESRGFTDFDGCGRCSCPFDYSYGF